MSLLSVLNCDCHPRGITRCFIHRWRKGMKVYIILYFSHSTIFINIQLPVLSLVASTFLVINIERCLVALLTFCCLILLLFIQYDFPSFLESKNRHKKFQPTSGFPLRSQIMKTLLAWLTKAKNILFKITDVLFCVTQTQPASRPVFCVSWTSFFSELNPNAECRSLAFGILGIRSRRKTVSWYALTN